MFFENTSIWYMYTELSYGSFSYKLREYWIRKYRQNGKGTQKNIILIYVYNENVSFGPFSKKIVRIMLIYVFGYHFWITKSTPRDYLKTQYITGILCWSFCGFLATYIDRILLRNVLCLFNWGRLSKWMLILPPSPLKGTYLAIILEPCLVIARTEECILKLLIIGSYCL